MLEMPEKDLDFAFDLNVKAQVRTIQAVLPQMLERGDGAIINMASVASSREGRAQPLRLFDHQGGGDRPDQVGRRRLRRQGHPLQRDLPRHGREPVAAGAPGARQGDFEAARAAFIARQPIGRIGTPEEIADLAVYLAGATYTTGQVHDHRRRLDLTFDADRLPASSQRVADDPITSLRVFDLRFPTSQSLDGSDAMNPDPDYSAAYVILETDEPGLEGHGLTFTIGRGNEICCCRDRGACAHLVVGLDLDWITRRTRRASGAT